jgi:hypothetical protein
VSTPADGVDRRTADVTTGCLFHFDKVRRAATSQAHTRSGPLQRVATRKSDTTQTPDLPRRVRAIDAPTLDKVTRRPDRNHNIEPLRGHYLTGRVSPTPSGQVPPPVARAGRPCARARFVKGRSRPRKVGVHTDRCGLDHVSAKQGGWQLPRLAAVAERRVPQAGKPVLCRRI